MERRRERGGHEEPYGGGDEWRWRRWRWRRWRRPLVVQHAGSVSGRETSLRRFRLALSSTSAAFVHAGTVLYTLKLKRKREFAAYGKVRRKNRGDLDERTVTAPASFVRVGRREACCESLPSIRPLPHLPTSFLPDVFPSGRRAVAPFPFLCSDISSSRRIDPRRIVVAASTVVVYYDQRGSRVEGRGAKTKGRERKITRELESDKRNSRAFSFRPL